MPSPFDALRGRLLRGGVSPRQAARYLQELGEHLDDILAEERRDGLVADTSRARARLGGDEALLAAMLARSEFRAWSVKAPFLVYLVAPCIGLVALVAIAMATVALTCTWLRRTAATTPGLPPWTTDLSHSAVLLSNAALPVLLGWVLTGAAFRQRSTPVWPVLGVSALAVLSSAFQVEVSLPSTHAHGEIELLSLDGFPGRFARDLLLNLVPYASVLVWRLAGRRHDGAVSGSRSDDGCAHDR